MGASRTVVVATLGSTVTLVDEEAQNWDWMINALGGGYDMMYWSEEPDWVHRGGACFRKGDSFMGIDQC